MNEIFINYLDGFILVHLDDILIYTTSKEEREKDIDTVISNIKKTHRLYALKAKCEFYRKKFYFLGFSIENGYTFPDEKKSVSKKRVVSTKKEKLNPSLSQCNHLSQKVHQRLFKNIVAIIQIIENTINVSSGQEKKK